MTKAGVQTGCRRRCIIRKHGLGVLYVVHNMQEQSWILFAFRFKFVPVEDRS